MTLDLGSVRLDTTAAVASADRAKRAIDGIGEAAEHSGSILSRAFEINQVRELGSSILGAARSFGAFVSSVEEASHAAGLLGPAYDEVRRATLGTVSAQQALRAQQSLVQSGLRVSASELGTITRAARDYARATGTETTQALEQLTEALRNGEATGLRRFGVAVREGTSRAQAFETTLAALERQQRATAAPARSLSETATALSNGFRDAAGSVGRFLASSTGIVGFFNSIADAAIAALARAREFFDWLSHRGEARPGDSAQTRSMVAGDQYNAAVRRARGAGFTGALPPVDQLSTEGREAMTRQLDGFAGARGQFAPASTGLLRADGSGGGSIIANGSGPLFQLNVSGPVIGDATALQSSIVAEGQRFARAQLSANAAARRPAATPPRDSAPRRGGGGGGTDPNQLFEAGQALAASRGSLGFLVGGGRPTDVAGFRARRRGESELDYIHALTDANREYIAVLNERYETTARGEAEARAQLSETLDAMAHGAGTGTGTALHDAAQERDREAEAVRERRRAIVAQSEVSRRQNDFGQQLGQAFGVLDENGVARQVSAANTLAEGVRNAFDSMTGAVQAHYAAVVEGRESAGEAMKGILHDTLLSIGQQAVVRALWESAQAIASLAIWDFRGAAMHGASAGVFAGVAVLAGLGAAATNPTATVAAHSGAAGGGAGAGGFGGGVRHASGGGETRAVVYNINVNGALSTREDIQDAVVAAHDRAGIRGVRPRSEIMAARRRAA